MHHVSEFNIHLKQPNHRNLNVFEYIYMFSVQWLSPRGQTILRDQSKKQTNKKSHQVTRSL